jgi:hypothetical protein
MGETKIAIASKVSMDTAKKLDELVEEFAPFVEGRSSLIRVLLEVAVCGIDTGRIPNTLDGLQEYLRESCKRNILIGGAR